MNAQQQQVPAPAGGDGTLEELAQQLDETSQLERVNKAVETTLQKNIDIVRENVEQFALEGEQLAEDWQSALDQIGSKLECAETELAEVLEEVEERVEDVVTALSTSSGELSELEKRLVGSDILDAWNAGRSTAIAQATFDALLVEALKTRLAKSVDWLKEAVANESSAKAYVLLSVAKENLESIEQCSPVACSPAWPLSFPEDKQEYEKMLVRACQSLAQQVQEQVKKEFQAAAQQKQLEEGRAGYIAARARRIQDMLAAMENLPDPCAVPARAGRRGAVR